LYLRQLPWLAGHLPLFSRRHGLPFVDDPPKALVFNVM